MKNFALNLRLMRTAHNLTQSGLAYELENQHQLQVSQSTICRLESGNTAPDAVLLFHVAQVFGCSMEQLFVPPAVAHR